MVATGLMCGCENDLEEVQRLTAYDKLPNQTVLKSRIVYTDSGRIRFEITAGRLDRYFGEEARDVFSGGVRVVSYNNLGVFETQIDAMNATNHVHKKLMTARDSVVLRNYEGKLLETEELSWDESRERVFTDKFVKITTPTEILFGDGLEAAQDFSTYEIINIKGRLKVTDIESNPNENQ